MANQECILQRGFFAGPTAALEVLHSFNDAQLSQFSLRSDIICNC